MKEFNVQNKNKINLSFYITMACNNRCDYCYTLDNLDRGKLINKDVMIHTVESIRTYKINNPDYRICVDILGGEPLMVVDDLIGFIDNLVEIGVEVDIFTNFNFPPDSNNIKKIVEYANSNTCFDINVSWHKTSNREYVMSNILSIKDRVVVSLLINNHNIKDIYGDVLWLQDNGVRYSIDIIRDCNDKNTFDMFDNEIYREMVSGAVFCEDEHVVLDGDIIGFDECCIRDYFNISKYYHTICRLSFMTISFDGYVDAMCGYPMKKYNIKDGIVVNDYYCNGYCCKCSMESYKKLVRER